MIEAAIQIAIEFVIDAVKHRGRPKRARKPRKPERPAGGATTDV